MIWHNGIIIDRDRNSVTYRGTITFNKTKKNVSFWFCRHVILAGPVSAKKLFDLLYDQDGSGGPLDGVHVTWVYAVRLRPQLLKIGLQIKTCGTKFFKEFHIIPLGRGTEDAH